MFQVSPLRRNDNLFECQPLLYLFFSWKISQHQHQKDFNNYINYYSIKICVLFLQFLSLSYIVFANLKKSIANPLPPLPSLQPPFSHHDSFILCHFGEELTSRHSPLTMAQWTTLSNKPFLDDSGDPLNPSISISFSTHELDGEIARLMAAQKININTWTIACVKVSLRFFIYIAVQIAVAAECLKYTSQNPPVFRH